MFQCFCFLFFCNGGIVGQGPVSLGYSIVPDAEFLASTWKVNEASCGIETDVGSILRNACHCCNIIPFEIYPEDVDHLIGWGCHRISFQPTGIVLLPVCIECQTVGGCPAFRIQEIGGSVSA